jgi:class 3 adenylate cyclase
MGNSPPDAMATNGKQRRRLRAVFAADVDNFGSQVSVDETKTLDALWNTRRIANEELAANSGWLFGMPGDGLFALFESAVDAVRCALRTQARLAAMPAPNALKLRIGVHLGEVLFRDELPFGEALVIAARLESLAKPGGILVSSSVMEAAAPRISATFCNLGLRRLKHIPRRIGTFSVTAPPESDVLGVMATPDELLDRTLQPGTIEENHTPPIVPSSPTNPATKIVSLPRTTPLVVPSAPQEPSLPQVPDANAVDTLANAAACLAELTHALTTHLGPMARVLVKRHADKIANPSALIAVLVKEIPTAEERLEFMARARQVFQRQLG